ncbi:hypothetical protein GN330_17865 [Nitratireductor sp. CAU 1489]|uniref:Uncharacterized protein n=1 Tax=Nitratireductor arenosus TaxID=2682096 RepID=A0A844QND0_9HYPH|nr:hypothetical protein [Nitratireductor arenosus]MVA99119.1 hypothetical protein [Nitratireductor arenosus]
MPDRKIRSIKPLSSKDEPLGSCRKRFDGLDFGRSGQAAQRDDELSSRHGVIFSENRCPFFRILLQAALFDFLSNRPRKNPVGTLGFRPSRLTQRMLGVFPAISFHHGVGGARYLNGIGFACHAGNPG